MIETRKATLLATKGGSGSSTFRATLPTSWIREMELGEDNKNIILKFEGDSIMIKKDEIFLVITEDEQIIYDIEEKDLAPKDQIVFESDIENLVKVELDEYTHEDEKEGYDTELEFYLSNAIREDYANYFIDTHLGDINLTQEAKEIIQEEVIDRIKKRLD